MPLYMKIEGIPGNATAKGFEKYFQLLSLNFGAAAVYSSPSRPVGKPSLTPMSVTFSGVDFPAFFAQITQGRALKSVVITLTHTSKAIPTKFQTFKLENAVVTQVQYSSSGDIPTVELALAYGKIALEEASLDGYTPSVTEYIYDVGAGAAG